MDVLRELVKIVNRKRLSKIDVFDKTFLNAQSESLYYKLYEGLESGQITDDASAAAYLYDSREKDARYRQLKSRFKGKILKSILLFDEDEVFSSELGRAYYECMTFNHILDIIIKMTGTNRLVYELIKENFSKAQKYNFYDILRNYSYYLVCYYALKGDKKNLKEEEKRYLLYMELAQKEQMAKYIYYSAVVDFVSASPVTNEMLTEVRQKLEQLYVIRKELNNPEIDFFYFYLAFSYYENSNELDKMQQVCDEAAQYMDDHPNTETATRRIAVLLYRMKALLHTRQYERGLQLLEQSSGMINANNFYNWLVLKEIEFKLYLQNHQLPEALSVYKSVTEHKSFKQQVAQITEKWKIYHAYWVFMDSYLNNGAYKFSLPKFLNDVPVNSKDKSGFNFSIRVVEMLFLFARKEYNLIFHKMDALRIYRTRYLNDNMYKRNHLFLSLLLKSEKSGFSHRTMDAAEWPEIAELRKQNNYIIADWEIIPYELLWDIFVQLAKK